MLATEFLHGQGLGNQLFCYGTTRMLAHRHGYDFGIKGLKSAGDSRVNQKGFYFMDLDYGKEVPDDLETYAPAFPIISPPRKFMTHMFFPLVSI